MAVDGVLRPAFVHLHIMTIAAAVTHSVDQLGSGVFYYQRALHDRLLGVVT